MAADRLDTLLIMDWSNIKRGELDMDYQPGEYCKEAGFNKLKAWLDEIGDIVWSLIYTPMHDLYGHFEFLRDRRFHITLCPTEMGTSLDTTDPQLIKDAMILIDRFNIKCLCLGSGDKHFRGVLEAAKSKGIKIAIVYGSRISLSREIREMADTYPEGHPKAGQQMIHLFSPTLTPTTT